MPESLEKIRPFGYTPLSSRTKEEVLKYNFKGVGPVVADKSLHGNRGILKPLWPIDAPRREPVSIFPPSAMLVFDGENDYVSAPDLIGGRSRFSVSALVRPDALGEDKGFLGQWRPVYEFIFHYDVRFDSWRAVVHDSEGNDVEVYGGSPQTGEWARLTATFHEDEELKLFVNGSKVGETGARGNPVNDGGEELRVGSDTVHSLWAGGIQNLKIYDRVLSEEEV